MRLLIVADGALAAEAIRRMLRHAPSCRVLGYVNEREPCGAIVANAQPDVVLVDDRSASANVLSRVREVRAAVPEVKVVLLTATMQPTWLAEATAAGVDAAIARNVNPMILGTLVREVSAGNVFHAFAPDTAAPPMVPAMADLTARELEILRLVAAGKSNSGIAAELWVAEQTVKFHLSNIYRKLGVNNRTEASHLAHVNRLVDFPTPAAEPAQRAAA